MSVTNVSKYIHNLFLITTVETNLNKAVWILTHLCNKAVSFSYCPVKCQIRNKSFTKITGTDDTFQESNNYFNYNNKIIILLPCIMPISIQIFHLTTRFIHIHLCILFFEPINIFTEKQVNLTHQYKILENYLPTHPINQHLHQLLT